MDSFKEAQYNHIKTPLKGCSCSYCAQISEWKSRNGKSKDKKLNGMARAKMKTQELKIILNGIR